MGKVRYRSSTNMQEVKVLAYWLFFNFSSAGQNISLIPKGNIDIHEGQTIELTIS